MTATITRIHDIPARDTLADVFCRYLTPRQIAEVKRVRRQVREATPPR